jgi:hypothetical protein
MKERKKEEMVESEAAFALTMILTGILMIAVAAVLLWFVFFAVNEADSLNAIAQGKFLP